MKIYVLYHGQCQDGFGSAWVAWRKFGDNATYVPCIHGAPIPEIPEGATVYMFDFSLKREEMLALYNKCNGLFVLDHHKTAQKELEGLHFAHFDMTKSGALLTWEYFYPNVEPPALIKHISDRDLWKFELPDTKAYSVALFSYPYDFNVWDSLVDHVLIREGNALLRYSDTLVNMICDKAELKEIDGHKVAVVNGTSHWSELGAKLLEKYPECDYAASYYIQGNQKKWSLRCRENFDVSAVAKKHNGGGHQMAAGYVEQLNGEQS